MKIEKSIKKIEEKFNTMSKEQCVIFFLDYLIEYDNKIYELEKERDKLLKEINCKK